MISFVRLCLSAFLFVCAISVLKPSAWGADADAATLPELTIPLIDEALNIDGALSEEAWRRPPLPIGEWITYNPRYGDKIIQQTKVWAVYDQTGLYFAFHCMDPEPDKIKTAISRRDTIFNDDWVGLSLDSLGGHQSSYEFSVNPSGVQSDMLNSSTVGEDMSPDWVWESAAKPTEDGYSVEIRIPFKTIRFKSGEDVRMEVLFWRRISRLGVSVSWPDLPPGLSIFTRHAPIILHDVKSPTTLELIPNFTFSHTQTLSSPAQWKTESDPDGGITGKFGISSTVTLDATIRPDFSQVESDAFQVEINQRYPLFYAEKRPFFMEGMGTFDLAGVGGDANMGTAVHTRRIVDPLFGVKLSGSLGKVTFATLSSADRAPGNTEDSDPLFEQRKYFNIGRILYSLGKGTYIGGLVTDSELGDHGYNRVAAGDLSLKFGKNHSMNASAITTATREFDGSNKRNGMAGQVSYSYNSKRQLFLTQFEHYDKDFHMDTAFYRRTGITSNWTYYSYNLHPHEERYPWFKKIAPFVWVQRARDRIQKGDENYYLGGVRFNFTRQGSLRVDYGLGKEAWMARTYRKNGARVMGGAQFYRWLYFYGYFRTGRSIYYDQENPFSGNSRYFSLEWKLQPNSKFTQSIIFERADFNRLSGEKVYSVDVINSKTTYQFSKYFFVRAIERYDSSRKSVLMDFLISYEPVPGTVAYAGYGTLHDRQQWDGIQFNRGTGDYINTRRSLFFKLSYLYRL